MDLVSLDYDIEQACKQLVPPFTTLLSQLLFRQQLSDTGEVPHLKQIENLAAHRAVLGGLHLVCQQPAYPVAMLLRKRPVERNALFHGKRAILLHGSEDGLVA